MRVFFGQVTNLSYYKRPPPRNSVSTYSLADAADLTAAHRRYSATYWRLLLYKRQQ